MEEKTPIITIAGKPGSGKSSTAKMIAKKLGYGHFSSGDLFRKLGEAQGMNVLHANQNAEKDSHIDHLVDSELQRIGQEETNLVIDSRTAWHWIPHSFKVFLDLDLDTAATRITSGMDEERLKNENIPTDTHAYALQLRHRLDSEAKRYMSLYQINPYTRSNYDLVIDTRSNDLETVMQIVLDGYDKWRQAAL